VGALRRPELEDERRPEADAPESRAAAPEPKYPRWMVLSGLLVYCAVFWAVIWTAGNWGVSLVRTAIAGEP